MGTITLSYQTRDGEAREKTFDSAVEEINLSAKGIVSIELSPLASCTSLQELSLYKNRLQALNLSPLASCTSLQKLGLSENQLQELDLSPLKECRAFAYSIFLGTSF